MDALAQRDESFKVQLSLEEKKLDSQKQVNKSLSKEIEKVKKDLSKEEQDKENQVAKVKDFD
jgi:hypothetical protein